ncbi:hypothetical protein PENARI_c028G03814 [Penicillium arizonense]|uniref:Uncharacterized protein n=1 Tax=Penicillium arizonense TaxID=1835702 RepID=A0A1F5L5Q6_PENAI|nr:hypothetical protein PENARI_c028G03814 [Penicillium arizonense]OGE48532.1 hypothetical protein PENARI_c028G03814 [Penicillium arizonense]
MDIVASAQAAATLAGMFLEIVQVTKHVIENMKGARASLVERFTRAERIRLNLELFRSGCQLAVEGYDIVCEITGKSLKAAYDTIRDKCGTKCGVAEFGNDCQVGMATWEDGSCGTTAKGGIDLTNPANWN